MRQPKRVLCVMDLAFAGRSSAAAVLPVLSACGVQACALPTALFSTHTGGFGAPRRQGTAPMCAAALRHFAREGIVFDAVYTGYLRGAAQFRLAAAAKRLWPRAMHIADPALADGGRLYGGICAADVTAMRALCATAGIVTPNATESALLAGEAPHSPQTPSSALRRLRLLSRGRNVLITGAPACGGGQAVLGRAASGGAFSLPVRRAPRHYPGTGDLFAAAVCGLVLRGLPLRAAAGHALAFVQAAAWATYNGGGEARHGVWFEPFLPMLAQAASP